MPRGTKYYWVILFSKAFFFFFFFFKAAYESSGIDLPHSYREKKKYIKKKKKKKKGFFFFFFFFWFHLMSFIVEILQLQLFNKIAVWMLRNLCKSERHALSFLLFPFGNCVGIGAKNSASLTRPYRCELLSMFPRRASV